MGPILKLVFADVLDEPVGNLDVCSGEIVGQQLIGRDPGDFLVVENFRRAVPGVRAVGDEGEMPGGQFLLHNAEASKRRHFERELLPDLPDETLFLTLAVLYLSAGKLPLAWQLSVRMPPAEEISGVSFQDGSSYTKMFHVKHSTALVP